MIIIMLGDDYHDDGEDDDAYHLVDRPTQLIYIGIQLIYIGIQVRKT